MTLQQLKYVVTVAKQGTISQAARLLYISQPTLTNAIKDLEQEIGLTLFLRTNKGIVVSNEGEEFLSYARSVIEQMEMLEDRYINERQHNPRFSVSCQHYSFAVNAFVDMIREFGGHQYDYTLRETQTYEIIEDVSCLKSEIGILYLCDDNEIVLHKLFKDNHLVFHLLYTSKPHVFISSKHPLHDKDILTFNDLKNYPYLSFEQGTHNSFYYSEEILSTYERNKNIKVRDRATLFNLLIGLNGYTISSGIIDPELNGENIVSKPLKASQNMRIGYIQKKGLILSRYGEAYIEYLKKHLDIA